MASGTFYPAVSGDDGYRSSTYNNSANSVMVGDFAGSHNGWLRFPSVTIPQGVTITAAYVKITSYSNYTSTVCNLNCYFNNVDNASAPADGAAFDALVLTGAVAWNNLATWTDSTQYDTPSLVSILQTVIDRTGWSSGNALQVIIKDNSSDSLALREISTIEWQSGAEKAELHVTWSTLEFTFTNPTPAHLSTVYGTTEQVCLTTTISGEEENYVYDADFYDEFAVQIGSTVSGIQNGQPAESNAYLSTPSGIDYNWYMTATSSGVEDTSSTYTFHNRFLASGTTEVNGVLTSGIDVRLYSRDTGELVGSSVSTISGVFDIETQCNAESYCVALSPYTDTNSLIYDFLEPGD